MRSCQPSRQGNRPCSLAIGGRAATSACCSPSSVLHDSCLASLVSCGVRRARPFVPTSRPSAAAALTECPALQRQQGGCHGEDWDCGDDGDGSEDEAALQGDAEGVPDADWSSGLTKTDWHTMNKQYRLGGYNFVVAVPSAHLLGAFQASSCHSLAAFGRVVGEEAASRGDIAPSQKGWRRASTIQRAAEGCLEVEFLGMVSSKIFDGRHWKCPPAHKRTVDVQHLIFKILSRMGCAAQEHLFLSHEQFPSKLLLILEDTDLGEVIVRTWETKKCMLDDLSAACIGKYKVAGFNDPEAKIMLQQVAQSMRMDIADIESRHASLRRVRKSVVQTHMLNKESSADLWPSGSSVLGVALCSGNKTEEERGIQHQKKKGCEICVGHFHQRAVCGEEG